MYKKLALSSLFATSLLALTACGGDTNTSSVNNENTTHPAFSWAKVAVSNNYSPSGDTTDLTPTFSWKAVSGATEYNFGHQLTSGQDWKEYTVPAASAGCATRSICNYKPGNHIFNEGEQVVWWVRGKVASQWKDWSSPYVFKLVNGADGNTNTPITLSPKNGSSVMNSTPHFTWQPVQYAQSLVIGLEKQDDSDWQSFTLNARHGPCPPMSLRCQVTEFNPSINLNNGNYTWWMRAELDNGSWTNWSNGADFTINAAGGGLKALTPAGTINTTKPTFTWTKQSNATDYQIGFEAGADWKEYSITAISACNPATECSLKPTNTGLKQSDNTTWYVRAKINGRWSDWTNGTNFNITKNSQAPAAPTNLKKGHWSCRFGSHCPSVTTSSLTLKWDLSTDKNKVVAYLLFRDGVKVKTIITKDRYNPNSPVITEDDKLNPDTTYTYTVKAIDAEGNTSDASNTYSGKTLPLDTTAPPTPYNFQLFTRHNYDAIVLTWQSRGARKYFVYRDNILIGDILQPLKNYPRYLDKNNLQLGATYSYTVKAVDAAGNESAISKPFLVTYEKTPPTVPTNLRVDLQLYANAIDIRWDVSDDNVGVVNYVLYRNGIGTKNTLLNTNYYDKDIISGQTYSYQVRAIDAIGNSSELTQPLIVKIP